MQGLQDIDGFRAARLPPWLHRVELMQVLQTATPSPPQGHLALKAIPTPWYSRPRRRATKAWLAIGPR